MSKSALVCVSVSTAELGGYAQEWLLNAEYQRRSKSTIATHAIFLKNLVWFLETKGHESCGPKELKAFFYYLSTGHEEPGGRWGKGNAQSTRPMRPISIRDYHSSIKTFFDWMVDEEILEASPFAKIERPRAPQEEKQPLTDEQVQALLLSARASNKPRRNEAIILMLVDSGARASELINLKVQDVDLMHGTFAIKAGKGNKNRQAYFGVTTAKVVAAYLRKAKLPPEAPLFPSTGHEQLTRSGLLQLVKRLGSRAGVKVCVHQMRRTFATSLLQNGADIVSVQSMLGHTNVQMTLRYLSVAKSHIESQHRQFSPGDRLRTR